MNGSIKKNLPSGKTITIETSWDDGSKFDMRILDLLRKYQLPGIFYIPVFTHGLINDQLMDIASTHDIGAHTLTHQVLRFLPEEQEREEITDSKKRLEEIFGREITSFCYPKGKFNERTVSLVKEAGYAEARTVNVGQLSYPTEPFRKHTTVHVFQRREYVGRPWYEMAREWLEMVMDPETPFNYFHVWGHGWEIDQHDEWEHLERFFYHLKNMLV